MTIASILSSRLSPRLCMTLSFAGIVLIASQLLVSGKAEQSFGPANVAAEVNGQPIFRQTLAAMAEKLDGKPLAQLTSERRTELLDFLIDEELLFQRAEALGLLTGDTSVRKAIIRGAIDRLVTQYQSPASEQQLRDYFASRSRVFERPLRMQVENLRFTTEEQARLAYRAFHNEAHDFQQLGSQFGAAASFQVSKDPLPGVQLRQYLGPGLTQLAQSLSEGQVSEPVLHNQGYYLLYMVRREEAQTPDFEQVRSLVEREYRRRMREEALDRAMTDLTAMANVEINIPEGVFTSEVFNQNTGGEG